jgi:23S rRNA pseudouridine1911/1915/1917 synthase
MRRIPLPENFLSLDILYEDNHCVAVAKPAGMLVQPDRTGDATLLDAVRDDLRHRHGKPGNVFAVPVHRLDRPVTGVVLFARTSKAASRLTAQFRAATVAKTYRALVEGEPPAEAFLEHALLKDGVTNRVRVVAPETPGARLARLRYRVVSRHPAGVLLEVHPETGRAHQIRVQLATCGFPIVGDLRYGSKRGLGASIALHAAVLAFDHPTRGERIVVESPLPAAWRSLLDA